jgi:hypothetical protein
MLGFLWEMWLGSAARARVWDLVLFKPWGLEELGLR